jgi:hypothetical protein
MSSGSLIAQRDQLGMRDVCPDPAMRAVDQLVDLCREERLQRRPLAVHDRDTASLIAPYPIRDRLVITPDNPAAARSDPVRSHGSRISITSSGSPVPSSEPRRGAMTRARVAGDQDRTGGGFVAASWGELAAARGKFRWRPIARIPWPRLHGGATVPSGYSIVAPLEYSTRTGPKG